MKQTKKILVNAMKLDLKKDVLGTFQNMEANYFHFVTMK